MVSYERFQLPPGKKELRQEMHQQYPGQYEAVEAGLHLYAAEEGGQTLVDWTDIPEFMAQFMQSDTQGDMQHLLERAEEYHRQKTSCQE